MATHNPATRLTKGKYMKSTLHLQTESPIMKWEDWLLETISLFADAWKVDKPIASQRLNADRLKEWYDDGFTPYVTFRENFQPLY